MQQVGINILYIIQSRRKCTMLNSTLTWCLVTFLKYSYHSDGSISIGRLVLLYIPKTSRSFYSTFDAWCNACCKKNITLLNCFFSWEQIFWEFCGLGLGTLNIWWGKTTLWGAVHRIWHIVHTCNFWGLEKMNNNCR